MKELTSSLWRFFVEIIWGLVEGVFLQKYLVDFLFPLVEMNWFTALKADIFVG